MPVQYTGKHGNIPRYSCIRGRLDYGEPNCIGFGGLRVDDTVEAAVLAVIQPAAETQTVARRDQARELMMRDLEAARYAAERAFRQYDAADPENRLVTGELESRWDSALVRVADIEKRIAHHDAVAPPPTDVESISFTTLAADFATVWAAPSTDVRLKKRIVRTVLEEAVGDINGDTAEIVLVLHWAGGAHTEHQPAQASARAA